MLDAVVTVRKKKMTILKASKHFKVPHATLGRYLKQDLQQSLNCPLGRKPSLDKASEDDLVRYYLDAEHRNFTLSSHDLKSTAFQIAKAKGIELSLKETTKVMGKKWLENFFRRHFHLKQKAKTKKRDLFYDIYKKEFDSIEGDKSRLYCVDITGYCFSQSKTIKLSIIKSSHQSLKAAKESVINVITCMSANGDWLYPMFVFPKEELRLNALGKFSPGCILTYDSSGTVQSETAIKWLKYFIQAVDPKPEKPVLLLVNGKDSNMKHIDALTIATENNVSLIGLPNDRIQRIQPLSHIWDIFNEEYSKSDKVNLGQILCDIYSKHLNRSIIKKCFQITGIYPYDENLLKKYCGKSTETSKNTPKEADILISDTFEIPDEDCFFILCTE